MKKSYLLLSLILATSAFAYEGKLTKGQAPATLNALIEKANKDTSLGFTTEDFILAEKRELATSNFSMYVQVVSGVPVAGTAVRLWENKRTQELILAEMHLNDEAKKYSATLTARFKKAQFSTKALKSFSLAKTIERQISKEVSTHATDSRIIGMKFKDQWVKGDLVRVVEVRGRRGVHKISVSLLLNRVIRSEYTEFPQSETVQAHVYPIYETVEETGELLPYEVRALKYVDSYVRDVGEKPFENLDPNAYTEDLYSAIFSATAEGRAVGFWSEPVLRARAEAEVAKLPLRPNDLSSGLLLRGRYATINLHPGIGEAFPDVDFDLKNSGSHVIGWSQNTSGKMQATPRSGFLGKPIHSQEELLTRVPFRLPDNNAVKYINSGFDEVQVYYGVTVLMEALVEMGFTDPEISTTPFHAFLFDPDIGMRDNAYYYDNTINFTTYNPGHPNLARDNPTIWHELGHAVMERIMGQFLGFADSGGAGYGGLSEGMADFVAILVTNYETNGALFPGKHNFRIMNNTGFYLTNEFHDDGEAYGGVMNDMLDLVLADEGRDGLKRFTDLTLEAMRLTRNHPMLSPKGWFEHMLYADSLGSDVREAYQYKATILKALASRNFGWTEDFKAASLKIMVGGTEVTNSSEGSREKPILSCDTSGTVAYDLKVSLNPGELDFIKFPAIVKVEYKKGALQGAINWEGEASNPTVYRVESADEVLTIPLKASMKCDSINQPDGTCKDYAYIQVFNEGATKPIGKKRFYLKIKDGSDCQ